MTLNFFERIILVAQVWDCGYGHVRMIKTPDGRSYVEFYNGGWSENEEAQRDLEDLGCLVVNQHPILLVRINSKFHAPLYKMSEDYWEAQLNQIESLCNIPTEIKEKYEVNL